MAARLGGTREPARVRGERASLATVNVGDLGLGAVAEQIQRSAAALDEADQAEARGALTRVREGFNGRFIPAAEQYDGQRPGFAAAQMSVYDNAAAEVRAGLNEGAQRRFDEALLTERAGVFDSATRVEARATATVMERQRAAERTARLGAIAASELVATQDQLDAGWRGPEATAPGFVERQLAALDERHKALMEAASDEDRPYLQALLTNQRNDAQLALGTGARQLSIARTNAGVKTGLAALENGVRSSPALLPKALAQVDAIMAGLPADQRMALTVQARSDLAAASLAGMQDREEWDGIDQALKTPAMKDALRPEAFSVFQARAAQALTSRQRQLAALTVEERKQSALASIRETGQAGDFDPESLLQSLGPIDGPAAVRQARQEIADAKAVYASVYDFAALTPKDQAARLELLKPKAGDPEFARKQEIYDKALATGMKLAALRQTDPALAMQADKASAALWRAAQDGSPANAQAWAADTLRRQTEVGVPAEARRVLPVAEAQRLVKTVMDQDAASRGDGLTGLYLYAQRYGAHGGRVLMELQRAGLPPAEAAVLNASDGDPVIVGLYTRSNARAAKASIQDADKRAITAAVAKQMGPLAETYGATANGQSYTDALSWAVSRIATAEVADGASPSEAAKSAAKWFVGRYHLDPRAGWRLPPALAAGRMAAVLPLAGEEDGLAGKVDPSLKRATAELPGDRVVRLGAMRTVRDFVKDGGIQLQPRGLEPELTAAQKRQRYADLVAKNGRWTNTEDDAGLVLTVPDPRGGFAPVLDEKGRPIVRTWQQLQQRAGRP